MVTSRPPRRVVLAHPGAFRDRHDHLTGSHGATLSIVEVASKNESSEMTLRLEAARREFDAQALRFEQAQSRLRATAEIGRDGDSGQTMLLYSEFARLQARLKSMPVIEQAKGILMAQQRCGPDEAFDLLRRASQRANVKVRVLAAQIIVKFATAGSESAGQPGQLNGYVEPAVQDITA